MFKQFRHRSGITVTFNHNKAFWCQFVVFICPLNDRKQQLNVEINAYNERISDI